MVPTWIIVVLVLCALMFFIFKTSNHVYLLTLFKQNFFYIVAIMVFIFVALSLTHIHSTYDIDVTTWDGMAKASGIYFQWLQVVFSNMGKVTGYAVQQEWVPNEMNNSTTKVER